MFREKKKPSFLSSPVGGETVFLEDTGDDVFAQKLLGDGIAVDPFESTFTSPCNGTVESVAKTAHAYNIHSDDGLDVLIHIVSSLDAFLTAAVAKYLSRSFSRKAVRLP